MNPDQLARFSQRMATLTLWLLISMMLLNAATWLFPALGTVEGGYGLSFSLSNQIISQPGLQLNTLPSWQLAGAIFLSSIPLFALAFGLYHLRQLFQAYGQKAYFSTLAARHLGKTGWAIGFWIGLNLLCEPLLSLWISFREPVGQRLISLSFSAGDLVALFIAASITIIAHILEQASQLHAEHQQFI